MNIPHVTMRIKILLISLAVLQMNQAVAAENIFKRGLDIFRNISNSDDSENIITALTNDDISAGLKEALRVGAERVVDQLGQSDGFNTDPQIHISLPPEMDGIRSALERVGMSRTFEDFETRLNRAAEAATPVAKELFIQAVEDLSIDDVSSIFKGEQDAATQYFRSNMSAQLSMEMMPIIEDSMAQVGAVQIFNQVVGRYNALPLLPEFDMDLNTYVVDKAMDGIFHYLAEEEKAIRENPVERTTELLRKVFTN